MDKNYLSSLVEQRLSTRKIAKVTGKSQTSIRYWIKKFGLKTCPTLLHNCNCGENRPERFYQRNKNKCKSCINKEKNDRLKENRVKAVNILGSKCIHCGYNKYTCSLDIHHMDPSKKDPNFKSHRGWSEKRLRKELERCVLLCRNCHSAVHNNEIKL